MPETNPPPNLPDLPPAMAARQAAAAQRTAHAAAQLAAERQRLIDSGADPDDLILPLQAAEADAARELAPWETGQLGDRLLAMCRDALARLAGDVPVLGIHLASMFHEMAPSGELAPVPVLVIVARGVPPKGPGERLTTWSAIGAWFATQRQIDDMIAGRIRLLRGQRAQQNTAMITAAKGLHRGDPARNGHPK